MNLFSLYHDAIWWLQRHSPGADKFLHVNAGLALWVLATLVSRRSFASPWTLVPMVAIELANELIDFIDGGTRWTLSDTLGDIVATFGWPVVLVMLFRHRRRTAAGLEGSTVAQSRSPALHEAHAHAYNATSGAAARP